MKKILITLLISIVACQHHMELFGNRAYFAIKRGYEYLKMKGHLPEIKKTLYLSGRRAAIEMCTKYMPLPPAPPKPMDNAHLGPPPLPPTNDSFIPPPPPRNDSLLPPKADDEERPQKPSKPDDEGKPPRPPKSDEILDKENIHFPPPPPPPMSSRAICHRIIGMMVY